MIIFDKKHYLFLHKTFLKGEIGAMNKFVSKLDDDKDELIEFADKEDLDLYAKQKQVYEVTLKFLKQFDKEVALSFLVTNMQIRGELGVFYEKLLEDLR